MFFKRSQQPGIPDSTPVRTQGGEVTTVAARPQPLEAAELRRVVNAASLGFKTTDELLPITGLIGQERALKAIQFGINIKSHDFNLFVLGSAGFGQDHGGEGPPRAQSRGVSDAAGLGLCLQFRHSQSPQGSEAPAWPGESAGEGNDRGARRVAQCPAGALRERRLPGATARHRRAVPFRQRRSLGDAEQEGAKPEHRPAAYADGLCHGADARRQGGQAGGLQCAARGHAPRRRDQDRRAREGTRPGAGAPAALRQEAAGPAQRAQRGRSQDRHPRCACTTCTNP